MRRDHYSPSISLIIGDFNARNSEWWANDITNYQGSDIENLASQNGLHQIIDEPTHILPNSASWIDLLFTSAMGFIAESGVLPSLYPRCHHQLIFAKVDLFGIFLLLAVSLS